MTGLKIILLITAGCFITSSLCADIYEWTDENGVRHFTNYAPPPEAGIMMKTNELPYDEAADHARLEAEREAQLELARLEIVERTIAIERREAEAEKRLAEAHRKAEEAEQEAEKLLNEARNDRYDYGDYGYPGYYRGNYPYRYNNRSYYRNETASIYFIKRPHIEPYKRHRYKNYQYGRKNAYHHNKYYGQRYGYKEAHSRSDRFRSNNGNHRNRLSIQSYIGRHNGRRHADRVHSVSRSRRN